MSNTGLLSIEVSSSPTPPSTTPYARARFVRIKLSRRAPIFTASESIPGEPSVASLLHAPADGTGAAQVGQVRLRLFLQLRGAVPGGSPTHRRQAGQAAHHGGVRPHPPVSCWAPRLRVAPPPNPRPMTDGQARNYGASASAVLRSRSVSTLTDGAGFCAPRSGQNSLHLFAWGPCTQRHTPKTWLYVIRY